jgi:Ca2+-binding EF-hand superfamily protein
MKRMIVFLTAMFLLTIGSNAVADSFQTLDTNGDRTLDRPELDRAAIEVFNKYDKNKDGLLTESEFNAIGEAKSKFSELDANHNGKLDMNDLRKAAAIKFEQLDENRDWVLDERECNPRSVPDVNPLFQIYF